MNEEKTTTDKQPLWEPTPEIINNSNMKKFMDEVNNKYRLEFENYDDLYQWSIENIEDFWEEVWLFFEVKFSGEYKQVIRDKKMPGKDGNNNIWFEGAELNFAENLLRHRDDRTAIVSFSENRATAKISYKELYHLVASCAKGLKEIGVKKGDRVAAITANIPEAVIAMLATTSIGAIWSSSSPDFGYQGILDRFQQIDPAVLIAVDGYRYNGKLYETIDIVNDIVDILPNLKKAVIIPHAQNAYQIENDDYILWNELLLNDAEEIEFERSEFSHPVYIMYSSGTTGKPKCIVHGSGGTLLQHFKELGLHTDLKREDSIFYFTTCGWMMWNWLVSSLGLGATMILFDGSPSFPSLKILWELIEEQEISIFGTSPKFITSCDKAGLNPKEEFNLTSLKSILSTGAPLTPENFNWIYSNVKDDVQVSSISGGTDIVSCFMLGSPMVPVYPGEIQVRGLGMKVESYDESGNPQLDQKGELVCSEVFPSMPVRFWNDEDNEKYYNSYFNHYPGTWRHGDYVTVTENGGIIVHGRSDATLNPGGIRIGTSEIYNIIEKMEEVQDSIVAGVNKDGDVEVALFVVLKNDMEISPELEKRIKSNIREGLTPRHVPKYIKTIKEVPVTLNGKKVEISVAKILNNEKIDNLSALKNPEALDQFKSIEF